MFIFTKYEDTPSFSYDMNILIGVTGSVAAIKLLLLVKELEIKIDKLAIKIICTENAMKFFDINSELLSHKIYRDQDEWNTWNKIGDAVLHIDLRNWADVLLIAPLDANTMAKICNGICDNLLTCVLRAWDPEKAVFLAPAMNSFMWKHPITEKQIILLQSFNYTIIPPIEKVLACGDFGQGAMAEIDQIVSIIKNQANSSVK